MKPLRALSLLLLLSVSACGTGEEGAPPPASAHVRSMAAGADTALEITDMTGRALVLDAVPQRILSLVPSATQTLVSLGAGGLLVGRTDYDTASWLRPLPSVGGGLDPNLEAVLALDPDLVIRFAGDSDPGTALELDRLGIPQFAISPDGIADIRRIIRDLGAVTAHLDQADHLLSEMDSTLSSLRARLDGRPRLRVAYILGGRPPWVAGAGSYIGELVEIGGGENVFSDLGELYGPVNAEVFLVRDIDLLLASEGSEFSIPETGTPLRRVSPSVEVPGPHIAQAALEMARAIHPEAFR